MALLTCRDLSLGYGKRDILIQGLSFSVEAGDYLCIVGENGTGKSTLLRTLLGLQKPLSGRISTGDGLQLRDIGYLPQQAETQKDFPASVEEVVLSGCQGHCGLRPFYNSEEKQRAAENMEKLHILSLQKRCYRELSGGQQQRVLLARALCAADRLLLLDEPVTGLDLYMARSMYQLVKNLNEQEKMTVIMISHDIAAAVRQASHILHLSKSWFWGTVEEYKKSAAAGHFLSIEGENNGPDAR